MVSVWSGDIRVKMAAKNGCNEAARLLLSYGASAKAKSGTWEPNVSVVCPPQVRGNLMCNQVQGRYRECKDTNHRVP